MEQATETAESADFIQTELVEISADAITQCVRLFSAFSSEDAIRIFLYAENGIASSTQAIRDLGLTQKRYYSRLKGLIDIGLIKKVKGDYLYTPMGKMMHKLGLSLIGVLENKERIDILYELSNAGALSTDERSRIRNLIASNSDIGPLLSSMITGASPGEIEMIQDYGDLAKKLVEEIGQAKKTVLLASNYVEASVVEAQMKAHRRGVEFKVLLSRETMSKRMTKLKLLLSPKIFLNLMEFSKSMKNNDDWFREGDIAFSFCIIDGCKCYFELPPVESEFSIAFYLRDEIISQRFSVLFDKFWVQSGKEYKDSISKIVLEG